MSYLEPPFEYQVGGSLPIDSLTYVKRQADHDFYSSLKARQFCYVFNSRQMGKSSLRVRTMRRLKQEGTVCIGVDLMSIGTSNISREHWYAGIIDCLCEALHLYETFDLSLWWNQHNLLSPLQRLSKFIEGVLLPSTSKSVVIFIDEVDSVLSLPFPVDDFFAYIRDCYNKRAESSDFNRLTFALLGVATPSALIQDKNRTPFNIGNAIDLKGFKLQETEPLIQGIVAKSHNPHNIMRAILEWTGGQPFLTQKICQLVQNTKEKIPVGEEQRWVENLVRSYIINDWEAQDEPEHLKTIHNRLLSNQERTGLWMGLYQRVLEKGAVSAADRSEEVELRLSGIVVRQGAFITVHNRIYQEVFNQEWVDAAFAALRPYVESINAWLASDREDQSCLLQGEQLQKAQEWAADKSLSEIDYHFFAACLEYQIYLSLEEARKKAELQTKIGSTILLAAIVAASTLVQKIGLAQQELREQTAIGEGNVLRRNGHYDKALKTFNAVLAENPRSAEGYANRGDLYRVMGNSQKALADFTQALKLDGKNATAFTGRGELYRTLKEYEEALKDFNQAVSLGESDALRAAALAGRGEVYRVMKLYDQALHDFTQALSSNPSKDVQVFLLTARGEVYRVKKEYQSAERDLKETLELNSRNAYASAILGQVYVETGNVERALANFNHSKEVTRESFEKPHITEAPLMGISQAIPLNLTDQQFIAGRPVNIEVSLSSNLQIVDPPNRSPRYPITDLPGRIELNEWKPPFKDGLVPGLVPFVLTNDELPSITRLPEQFINSDNREGISNFQSSTNFFNGNGAAGRWFMNSINYQPFVNPFAYNSVQTLANSDMSSQLISQSPFQ